MAIVQIPTRQDVSNYRIQTVLDGDNFFIRLYFNARDEAWYLDILDANENPVRMGTRLSTGTTVFPRVASTAKPDGAMFVYDTRGDKFEATRDDLGTLVLVLYEEAAA